MSGRKWHLEHGDGREWTQDELDELAVRLKEEARIAPYDTTCRCVCIDQLGETWMLNDFGEWDYVGEGRDMEVVWDG